MVYSMSNVYPNIETPITDLGVRVLEYSGGWQDIVISVGMLVFILSVAGMVLDDETYVPLRKAAAYGTAQLMIAIANASLGLWLSAGLLVIGSAMWFTLGYQNGTDTDTTAHSNGESHFRLPRQ